MTIINQHDWSDVEKWFDEKAAAAGKPKGGLAYYGHSETLYFPENLAEAATLKTAEDLGYFLGSSLEDLLAKVFSNG